MIELGNYNTLTILRDTGVGLFLGDDDVDDLLLPTKYVPEEFEIGDPIEVFCYLDHEERPIATTLKPFIKRGSFAYLRVAEINNYGAFLDWGLEKHLLAPFKEQRIKMQEGQWYVVHCYLDEVSFRLVASSKLDRFFSNDEMSLKVGEEVDLLVYRKSELGWDVVVDDAYRGLIFNSEVFQPLALGDSLKGFVKKIRPDQKLDISLQPEGLKNLDLAAESIYKVLVQHQGYLPLHDKSDPDDIRKLLQMSKKTFKKGIGTLYRLRQIEIRDDGIYKS